jgi:hypothetical protein
VGRARRPDRRGGLGVCRAAGQVAGAGGVENAADGLGGDAVLPGQGLDGGALAVGCRDGGRRARVEGGGAAQGLAGCFGGSDTLAGVLADHVALELQHGGEDGDHHLGSGVVAGQVDTGQQAGLDAQVQAAADEHRAQGEDVGDGAEDAGGIGNADGVADGGFVKQLGEAGAVQGKLAAGGGVDNELSSEFRRVQGKHGILARLAQAALDPPEELVRTAIYPAVGTATLADIIAEAKANEKELRIRVRVKLRGSYSRHYRRGLPKLLRALDFHCNNTTFQPVMDALKLLDRYAGPEAVFYDRAETVPIEHVVPEDWQEAVADERGRIERIPYELCVLVALRKAIRRREIWVEGGTIWHNPRGRPAGRLRRQPGRALRGPEEAP